MSRRLDRLRSAYRAVALLGLNTLLLFVLLNLLAVVLVVLAEGRDRRRPGSLAYGLETLEQVYPGWDPDEVRRLLRETWTRVYEYRPFVQHRERAQSGRYVNVHEAGFRLGSGASSWPPSGEALNVFVFGGSTTFGYGLADGETIPSRIQEALTRGCSRLVAVYNFGGGNFYSEQERILFEQLLIAGHAPDAAVFVDGMNEWQHQPKFTARLQYLMGEDRGELAFRALRELPLARLLRRIKIRFDPPEEVPLPSGDPEAEAGRLVDRWLRNRRLLRSVAEPLGVTTLFVWQPVPSFRYDLSHHPFSLRAEPGPGDAVPNAGYARIEALRCGPSELTDDQGFLWLADLQRDRREALYIDRVHYTAAFSREIAERIADRLVVLGTCEPRPDDGQ